MLVEKLHAGLLLARVEYFRALQAQMANFGSAASSYATGRDYGARETAARARKSGIRSCSIGPSVPFSSAAFFSFSQQLLDVHKPFTQQASKIPWLPPTPRSRARVGPPLGHQ